MPKGVPSSGKRAPKVPYGTMESKDGLKETNKAANLRAYETGHAAYPVEIDRYRFYLNIHDSEYARFWMDGWCNAKAGIYSPPAL